MLISLARLIHSPNNRIRTSHRKKVCVCVYVCVCVFVFGFVLSFTFGCIGLAMLFSPLRRPQRATHNDYYRGIAESDVEMSDFCGCFRHHPWDGLAPIVNTGTLMVRSITQHRTSPHAVMFCIWPVSQIPLVAPTIRHQVPQSTRHRTER